MPVRPFCQVDVFAAAPYEGNPVAVVLDAHGLGTQAMQRFARWTNLSETTFLLPPQDSTADYRLRIFTPVAELPFAGHPTLGSCHAWLEAGGQPHQRNAVVQECGAGLVHVRRTDLGLAFAEPPLIRSGPVEELLVLALRPGLVDPPGSPEAVEVRAFFPVDGATVEDPVTGSLNAALAGWLTRSGRLVTPYTARQGTALGRAGRVHLTSDADGRLWTGGGTVTCITGQVDL